MRKGGIKRTLLLSLAMFIAGYLTAVATLKPETFEADNQQTDYSAKLESVTSQIKDAVKEHGASAYSHISEYLRSLNEEESDSSEYSGEDSE